MLCVKYINSFLYSAEGLTPHKITLMEPVLMHNLWLSSHQNYLLTIKKLLGWDQWDKSTKESSMERIVQ